MSGYTQSLATGQSSGVAITGTTITTLLPTNALFTLPGGSLAVGSRIEIEIAGQMNTVVTTPGTLIFTIKFGAVAVFTSQAQALNIVAQTNATWKARFAMTCLSVGSGTVATFRTLGEFTSRASLNAPAVATTTGVGVVMMPDTAPAAGTGFDSTISNLIDVQATLSVAGSMTCMGYDLSFKNWQP